MDFVQSGNACHAEVSVGSAVELKSGSLSFPRTRRERSLLTEAFLEALQICFRHFTAQSSADIYTDGQSLAVGPVFYAGLVSSTVQEINRSVDIYVPSPGMAEITLDSLPLEPLCLPRLVGSA